jgi:GABA permease
VLVVANVTAASPELIDALEQNEGARFTLIVPATPFGGGRAAAKETLQAALEDLRAHGLEVDGLVGDADACVAVTEAWDPRRYDEIIVSTLPMRFSKWLHAGLPERIEKLTGAPVTHVVSQPAKPAMEVTSPPPHEDRGMVLGPLSVLGWGGHRED